MDTILLEKQTEYLNAISKLRIIDDDFMTIVFHDQACLELLLSHIFHEEISVLKYHGQHLLKNLQGRDAQLDVLIKTKDNKYINIEVQRDNEGAHPKRARYHSSLIDTDITIPKERWKDISTVFVVFITEHDVLKKGLPIYHIYRMIEETGEAFQDESGIIYVNASIQDNTPLGMLMHDFMCDNYQDMYNDVLRKRVRYFKESEGGKQEMCEIMDEIRRKGVAEGRFEGKLEGKVSTLVNLLKQKLGKLEPEIITQIEGSTSEQLDLLTVKIFNIETEQDIVNTLRC